MIKKSALAAAIIALGFGATGAAHASAFGTSILIADNFLIIDAATNNVMKNTDFASLTGNNNGNLSASINSVGDLDSGNQQLDDPVDLPRVCVGDCAAAPGENDFTSIITPPPTDTYASSDNQLSGTAIDFGIPITTGADARTRTDVSIGSAPDFGNSTANLGLTSTFDFILGSAGLGGFDFTFDYVAYLAAYTSPDEIVPANAFASLNWSLTLRDVTNGIDILNWAPGVLNQGVSVDAPVNGLQTYSQAGSLANSTGALLAGVDYRLTIAHKSDATARAAAAVPEPGSLALLGLGLFGIAGFGKRVGAKRS